MQQKTRKRTDTKRVLFKLMVISAQCPHEDKNREMNALT